MITARIFYFFIILAVFLIALVAIGAHYYLRYRKSQRYPYGRFEDLLKRLGSVDRDHVALIALDFIDESGNRKSDDPGDSDLDPSQIWHLIGGMKGLEVVERNCIVLVDLVSYVQQWYPEALAVTEQLRLNGREIEWHVERLKSVAQTVALERSFPDYAQRAIATYYLMTRRVLALYEQLNLPGLVELQRTL